MLDPSTRRRKGGQRKTKQPNRKSYTCYVDYQGEAAEPEGENETRPGDKLQAVLEATGNINLNGGPQHKMKERTEEGDNTIQHVEPNKKHPGDALQADIPKRPKTEKETTEESGAAVLPTEME